MKKAIVLLLVLMLAMGLLGCGNETAAAPAETELTAPEMTLAPTETEQTVPETTEAAVEDRPVTLGKLEGWDYTNEYLGIGCTFDENWAAASAKQTQQLPEQADKLLLDAEYTGSDLQQLVDLTAINGLNISTISIQYNRMTEEERQLFAAMDYDSFADTILNGTEEMAGTYTEMGFDTAEMEKVTVNFLGQERTGVLTTASLQGIHYYVLQLYEHNLGHYYVTISVSTMNENTTQSLLDMFYPLD